jgi:hypothetical protein
MLAKAPNNKFHNKITQQQTGFYMQAQMHSKAKVLVFLVSVAN